jgi:hypothetical protein
MRAARGARSDDPYFVWLVTAMLAAFGLGLTDPHGLRLATPVANPPVMDAALPWEFARALAPSLGALPASGLGLHLQGVGPSLARVAVARAPSSAY